jgi:hypothetical protein
VRNKNPKLQSQKKKKRNSATTPDPDVIEWPTEVRVVADVVSPNQSASSDSRLHASSSPLNGDWKIFIMKVDNGKHRKKK